MKIDFGEGGPIVAICLAVAIIVSVGAFSAAWSERAKCQVEQKKIELEILKEKNKQDDENSTK